MSPRRMNSVVYALGFLLACAGTAVAEPAYQFKLAKPEDSIVVHNEEKRAVFVVTSSSGIGSATLSRTSGPWPRHVVLRFQYGKDRGFRYFESFVLTTARFQASGSASASGRIPFHLADAEGKLDSAPAGLLHIRFERRKEGIEVILPANLLVGYREARLAWIDAFR